MHPLAVKTVNVGRTYRLSRRQRQRRTGQTPSHQLVALDNVTLEVNSGELFGLLGSNGAGKTTLIKILTTLLAPTSGYAFVDGLDVVTEADKVRPRINMVCGGETSGYGILTVRENLWLFSQLYGVKHREALARIETLLAALGLIDQADAMINHLSTGQRQKMNLCRGLVTDPKILFLDEPTLGLDVTAARTTRQLLRDWLHERPARTLLLTTHYLKEADELCDRVAVIDRGKVLACNTPAALKRRVQRHSIFEMALTPGTNGWHELARLPGVHECTASAGLDSVSLRVALLEEAVVGSVVQEVVRGGARILSLKKVEPTLEDVFVALVGHGVVDEEDAS